MHIEILRLGHRVIRDERITTHLALLSRLFDVKKFLVSEVEDKGLKENIKKLTDRWGGELNIVTKVDSLKYLKNWNLDGGYIVHLTMYGQRLDGNMIKTIKNQKKVIIIVGSQKVESTFFEIADLNLSIGNQPHSELSALTILLYEMIDKNKDFLYRDFKNSKHKIIPSKKSKTIVNVE
ncbi:MAG: tRNA (cytidine(56)-2'-O)-methyltransferase [Candidatus Lokiarchaeota archaeon]|nr:tRNA (cytidine(56)-2'-O)-methyltransferase [Candidatus Lokiarchaeota archaeon]